MLPLLPELPQDLKDQCIALMKEKLPGVDEATLSDVFDENTKIVNAYIIKTYFPNTANT